jgi:hypothetical protein
MSNEKNMFEVATRERFRFPFRGMISVEDLWMLSTKDLDSVFKVLNSELKQTQEESLLDTKTKENEELILKVEIVKYIVTVKLQEEKARAEVKKKKEEKQRIMEIIASKEDEAMESKSVEELKKLLESYND